MRTRTTSVTIASVSAVLLALVVLLGVMSPAGLSGWAAAARVDPGAAQTVQGLAADWTFQGRVYEGELGVEPPGSQPLEGVTVSVYGSNNPYPDPGTFIGSTTTDGAGWYGLTVNDDEVSWEFYHIRETDPTGYTSVGATSVDGTVRTENWIEYVIPLEGKVLTGNKFWDRGPETVTPTPTSTEELPEHTPTPTATEEPELQADLEISKWIEGSEPVAPGGQIEYVIYVTNWGPDDAPNVVVTDWLPPEVAYNDSQSDPRCDLDDSRPPRDVVVCELGDLPIGEYELVVRAQVDEGICDPIYNLVEVWSDIPDPDPEDNVVELETGIGPCEELYTFTGHVYQGYPPGTGTPIGDVVVQLWGDENESPEDGATLLAETVTNGAGEFTLVWEPGDLFPYYHVIEVDSPGTYSTGAQAEPPGYVTDFNVVSYLDIPGGTYDGIAFWDEPLATSTPTPTSTATPTGTVQPTPTPTATPTGTVQPTHTSTVTPTPTATPTGEAPQEWVVNTTADHDDGECLPLDRGDCTLREAMRIANEHEGPDTILFDIPIEDPGYDPDTEMWVIEPQSDLPVIEDDGTTIDGTGTPEMALQAGRAASSDHAWLPSCKCPSVLKIAVKNIKSPIKTTSAHGALKNLVIFTDSTAKAGVLISGSNAYANSVSCVAVIRMSYHYSSGSAGVAIEQSAHNNFVDCIWSMGHTNGVAITGSAYENTLRRNNLGSTSFGTVYVYGELATHNGYGVYIGTSAHDNYIGNPVGSGAGNMIVGNKNHGVWIDTSSYDNLVRGNYIGVQPGTLKADHNAGAGVYLSNNANKNTIGPDNVIAKNGQVGVVFSPYIPAGVNEVTENSIYDNLYKGIMNSRTKPPIITSVSSTEVKGTTNPTCSYCSVEIFANPSAGTGIIPAQGKTYLGWAQTWYDGTWTWSGSVPSMSWVTATLTKSGDTSEFSSPKQVAAFLVWAGKTCKWLFPWLCWPDIRVTLWAKSGGEWEKIDSAITDEEGQFTLADSVSEAPQSEYKLVMADSRYRVVEAESASGGEVQDDGSILFIGADPGVYEENIFYVEEVEPQERAVNTTTDHDDGNCDPLETGDCTLREAINAANEGEGPTSIRFDIPDGDPGFADGQWTIQPEATLPDLTADGLTIGTCTGQYLIVLDGTLASSGASAFTLTGANQKVQGMVLTNWPGNGVRISGSNAYNNVVACNQIVDNVGDGVRIEAGAHHNTVGGSLGRNLISGNSGDGVGITGTGTNYNDVTGNYIGTDEAGTAAWANSGHGVRISGGARYNSVGGDLAEDGNVIAGNAHSGVMIEGSDTWSNEVGANLIGLALGGATPLGNGHHGVGIYGGAMDNNVGSDYLQPNVIGGNSWSGVAIVNSDLNLVHGNYIGTDPSGVRNLGNSFHGVHVVGGIDNAIGSNTITHNGADGVRVEGATTTHNWITVNAITANGGKGIELVNGGNTELAPPVITSVTASSVSGTACAGCTVEIFSDPADEGQYVHSPPTAVADSSGNWSWSGTLTGANVTATATDWFYNTSEFSTYGLLVFTGRVDFTPDSPFPRPIPMEVGLYGSQEASELGERLLSVPTNRDGTYELRYGGTAENGGEYTYFNLALVDPAYEVDSAESGSGGRVTEQLWIQFEMTQLRARAASLLDTPLPPFPDNYFWIKSIVEMWPDIVLEPVAKFPLYQDPPASQNEVKDFIIDGIEVTQAIQCFDQNDGDMGQFCTKDNQLPLAAGKPAVIRVYPNTTDLCFTPESAGSVRIDLYVEWADGLVKHGYGTYTIMNVACASSSARRKSILGTANFYVTIPTDRKLNIWAEINKDKARLEPNYNNNRYPATGTVDVDFKTRKTLSIGYVLVDYHPQPSHDWSGFKLWKSSKASASWVASKSAYGLLEDIYPIATLNYQKFGSGQWGYTGPDVRDNYTDPYTKKKVCGECEMLNHLTKQWQAWKLSGKSPPDQIFVWLPQDARAPLGVGAADTPLPPLKGQGKAAFGEEKQYQILAHEVGHNLKLYHAPCGVKSWLGSGWPYPNDGLIQEVGFDVAKQKIKDPTSSSDIMSYCSDRWISPYHWKELFDELAPSTTSAAASSASQSYALVSGLVGDDDTGELDPLVVLESESEPPAPPTGGEYCLAFYDLSDVSLASYCFDLSFANVETGEEVSVAHFSHALPYPAETARVAFLHGDTLLDERTASPSVPELSLESPSGGEPWYDTHTVAWTASDADGDDLTFAVFYSNDGGQTWTPMAMDLTQTSYRLDTTSLPGGEEVQIRVLVSDGFHTTSVDSQSFSVPTKAPDVYITTPSEGALLPPERALYLHGSAYDPEDGPLSDAALSWWSDGDGLLGRGATLIVPGLTLTSGWHTITLRAVDSDELMGLSSVSIFVGHRAYLPIILKSYS